MSVLLASHVAVSLCAILAGIVVLLQLAAHRDDDRWALAFLVTTFVTSASGFPLPAQQLLPSHVFGIISVIAIAVAAVARYERRLAGGWRHVYLAMVALSFYLNGVVLLVQSFRNVGVLRALAPTQSEPPFLLAQLALFALAVFAVIRASRGAARVMVS